MTHADRHRALPGLHRPGLHRPLRGAALSARRRGPLRLARSRARSPPTPAYWSSARRTRSPKPLRPTSFSCPAGSPRMEHARDEKLLDWLRRAHETATWTTSVCSGSVILAAAGLLKGKRATSHWMALSALKAFGVTPVGDERIVHEGDRSSPAPGCRPVSTWRCGWPARSAASDRAKAIQLSMEYDPQPPFDSGHMSKASATTKATATALMSQGPGQPDAAQGDDVCCCGTRPSTRPRQRLRRG